MKSMKYLFSRKYFCLNTIELLLFLTVSFIGLFLRYLPRDFMSGDMQNFLIPWFQIIRDNGGFESLHKQVGDYGLLYQTIIAVFSYIDLNPVYLYKCFSIIFDYLLACSVAYFIDKSDIGNINNNKTGKNRILIYAFVLLLPTVVMNSAFWGQSDSIYTFFLLWSLWFLYKERYHWAFIMLGCSFAFKLQCILMVPLFLFFYVCKRFSLSYFLITLFTFWFSGFLAYIHGRGLLDGFGIYFFQVNEYQHMWMNVPSFWVFLSDDYKKFHVFAICLTLVILGIGLRKLLKRKSTFDSYEQFITIALFIEWTCIIFLPSMHERYTYVMDLLALMLALLNKKYVKYATIAIITSCLTYNTYLFTGKGINSFFVFVYILSWICFCYDLFINSE